MGSRTTKRRKRPPPEPRPVIAYKDRFQPEGPRGPNRYKAGSWEAARNRGEPWLRFRRILGLSDTRYLAGLLGVTVRSIQRWEYGGTAPRWYHAALLGLRDVWGQPLRD